MSLRILHVVPYYEHAWAYGGIPRLATTMTRGLAARGHHVTVCTTDVCDARSRLSALEDCISHFRSGRSAVATASSRANQRAARSSFHSDMPLEGSSAVDVHVFRNVSNRLAYHYQFFTPLGLRRFLRDRGAGFDIAHVHACRNLPGEIAARVLRKLMVPYVVSPNGTAPAIERRLMAKRVFDFISRGQLIDGSSRVLAVSHAERKQLLELGLAEDRIRLLPNPIDESEYHTPDACRFRRKHGVESQPIVLFLGKLTPRKGVDVLLHAFDRVAEPAHLIVAGNDMGAGAGLTRLVSELDLDRRVTRIDLLQGLDRLDALAAASVVVYPSRDEVFGLVAIEALMCGTPVVVCDDSGCGEIIAAIGGGLRVPYGQATQLAHAITSIVDSPGVWNDKARAASVRARERFGSVRVCAELESLYHEVLQAA